MKQLATGVSTSGLIENARNPRCLLRTGEIRWVGQISTGVTVSLRPRRILSPLVIPPSFSVQPADEPQSYRCVGIAEINALTHSHRTVSN